MTSHFPSRVLAALVAVVAVAGTAARTLAADAQLVSLGTGTSVSGQIGATPRSISYAGTFNLSIDGGPTTQGYCVDIQHSIRVGDTVPQVPPTYPGEVLYILGNYYPNATAVLSTAKEAAAVQSAIWFFTDGFQITSPSDIMARANQIVAAAQGHGSALPPVPHDIVVTPATMTRFLPGDTTHTVTATLNDTNGQHIPGSAIRVDVAGAAGPKVFQGTTDGSGQYVVSYTNATLTTGSDTITATVTFTVPVGQEFKTPDKQGIVLAGQPRSGTVDGTATINWVAATCGDGKKNQAGEECDDGNLIDGDGCDSNCTLTRCGNNIRTAGEECDDGNAADGDGCDSNCTTTRCGNGVRTGGEQCDDGNAVDGDGCDSNCTTTRCGNGIRTTGEECDDGNATSGDGCDANCTTTRCGNGIRTTGEECDDGNGTNGDGCDANCTTSRCGNGIVTGTEQCDDGNQVNGDGCDNNCTFPSCGNGVRDTGEQCDDGNHVNGDGCDNNCTVSACGNGIKAGAEQCDDGNLVDGDGCDSNCTPTGCGNGVRTGTEVCDDGNLADGDGCDSNCTPTGCGNGIITGTEQCDDGNLVAGDGCQPDCTIQTCGNGHLDPGELCDDGNTLDGDGCSSDCKPQEICGDLEDEDGDGLYDCEDPDCVGAQNEIFRDPGRLFFVSGALDKFRIKGGIPLTNTTDIDPPHERVGILLTNPHAVLFRQWLDVGAFPDSLTTAKRWLQKSKAAKTSGGVFQTYIGRIAGNRDRHQIRLKLYQDMTPATEATMTLEMVIGNNLFCSKATWISLGPSGWKLNVHDEGPTPP